MDGVERLTQMNEVERMREVMDVISDNMRKQNDKDRMEMLAMLASTTAMETNMFNVNFARRANTEATGTKTKKNKGRAIMKGVEQADNDKDKDNNSSSSFQSQNNAAQNQQSQQQSQQQESVITTTPRQEAGLRTDVTVLYSIQKFEKYQTIY